MFLYILGIENDDTLAMDLSDDNLYDSIIRKSLSRNEGNCTFGFMIKWVTKVNIGIFKLEAESEIPFLFRLHRYYLSDIKHYR